ncbi:MAG: hypothetical protein A2283_24100 [Lentisphaerae bacterium RIFOXYA12_FULL_48_11]|nr:MAG: hypothetical protein A2283_24100 [Lentisphaerae bacterium RIFOXYA12_FULL_48_11]
MKPFTTIASVIFMLICIAHVARLVLKMDIMVNGFRVPLWVSMIGCLITGALSILLWIEGKRR